MQTKSTVNGGSAFRIKRPSITSSGFTSDVDPIVKEHLDELDELLAKRVFLPDAGDDAPSTEPVGEGAHAKNDTEASQRKALPGVAAGHCAERLGPNKALLKRALRPRRTDHTWPDGSLAHALKHAKVSEGSITLADYIDRTPELSQLKYSAQESVLSRLFAFDYNTRAVLDGHPAIADYLIAYAYGVMDVEEIHGLTSFLLNNRLGAKNVATYAAVSAARTLIELEQLKVPNPDDDNSPIIDAIEAAGTPLSTAAFKSGVRALINDFLFNSKEAKLIDEASVGNVPIELKPLLIKYIKSSPVPITKANINFFLPNFILKAGGNAEIADTTEQDTAEADRDFDVEFLEDDQALIQVSVSAVKCAAQLYYGMVLGDELEVFEAMNYFTHRYLLRESIEIQESRLREDLQLYVFSNKFVDLKTNKVADRTRPAERKMFYRQVFNYGGGQIGEDLIVNREFPRLWKVLVLESANYLERARESFNPDGYVSKQNVMQAVEELQYNLSTHCTGMANVVTPLIYAELDFVIRRIFMHKEILRQVVPSGGTWWRVVETLYLALRNTRPKATVLYNKAKLGHEILRDIATYNPATFENDETFSAFISNVDAFITTQSIIQAALTDDLTDSSKAEAEEEEAESNGNGASRRPDLAAPGVDRASVTDADAGASAEWDF